MFVVTCFVLQSKTNCNCVENSALLYNSFIFYIQKDCITIEKKVTNSLIKFNLRRILNESVKVL